MNILLKPHQNFLSLLIQSKVDFILIGGYAVIYHGYGRTTGDLDLWLKPDNENKAKFLNALRAYSILEEDVQKLATLDFTQTFAFHIGEIQSELIS